MIGVGDMGGLMGGHIRAKGHDVCAFDIDPKRMQEAEKAGLRLLKDLADAAATSDFFIVMVGTDEQSALITRELANGLSQRGNAAGQIVVTGTSHPELMRDLGAYCAERAVRFVDAPVVYGLGGARSGKLLSLCGGSPEDVEAARPALMSYSRDVLHVGPLGAGQMAKACNNLLHWIHSVANYEALLLAKRYGIDAQRMREVLLQAPGTNGTLARWDGTKFTWQEKDMDVVMDLAQKAGLVLPLSGHVDQLVKLFHADDVAALLYGKEAAYLGQTFSPLTKEEGGLSN